MQLMRWDGKRWVRFGDVLSGSSPMRDQSGAFFAGTSRNGPMPQ